MAFSFTNTTPTDQILTSIGLDMATDYARVTDEPTEAKVSNKTATLEQPEVITYKANPINKVNVNLSVRNPSPVQDGVLYSVRVETIDRVTVGTDTIDEPIAMWLTVKHPMSNNWDNAKVATVFKRLCSALIKDQTSTGTAAEVTSAEWRFEDLMRSALMPVED